MSEEHKGKKVKPKPNHPWRVFVPTEIHRWAYEKSRVGNVRNYRRGGGKPQR